MKKQIARTVNKEKRKNLTKDQIEQWSLDIANRCLTLPIWNFKTFHVFLPIEAQAEVNTEFLLHILNGKDKDVLISKTDFKAITMTHVLLTDNTRIKLNAYKIPEPIDGIQIPSSAIDVVFVPLLAFDSAGQRVGYGKGFYDKFLSECRTDVVKIGLSFFEAEQDILEDTLDTDVPLDYCITPHKTYSF